MLSPTIRAHWKSPQLISDWKLFGKISYSAAVFALSAVDIILLTGHTSLENIALFCLGLFPWIPQLFESFEIGRDGIKTKRGAHSSLEQISIAANPSSGPRPHIITKISQCRSFWTEQDHIDLLQIHAINGFSFFKQIDDRNVTIDKLEIIFANEDAIDSYYKSFANVDDAQIARNVLKKNLEQLPKTLSRLVSKSRLGSFEQAEYGVFPVALYAIADRRRMLLGRYGVDSTRRKSIGLRSYVWEENDAALINFYCKSFDEIWESINGPSR